MLPKKLILTNTNIPNNKMEISTNTMNTIENEYYVGDNLDYLKQLSNNSIDFIYFDPPYNTGRNFFNFDDKFKSVNDYIEFIKLLIIGTKQHKM